MIISTKKGATWAFPVNRMGRYQVNLDATVLFDTSESRAAVLLDFLESRAAVLLDFLDSSGEIISPDIKNWSFSRTAGSHFKYLKCSDDGTVLAESLYFDLKDPLIKQVRIRISIWRGDGKITILHPPKINLIQSVMHSAKVGEDAIQFDVPQLISGQIDLMEPVCGGNVYELLTCAISEKKEGKDSLLKIVPLDENGDELDSRLIDVSKNFSYSKRFGEFIYIAAAPQNSTIRDTIIIGCYGDVKYLKFSIIKFAKQPSWLGEFSLEMVGINDENFISEAKKRICEFTRVAKESNSKICILYSGSRRIRDENRANRAMMMAEELDALNIPTLYVYSRPKSVVVSEVNEYRNLIQIPLELFAEISSWIADRFTSEKAIFIASFPDMNSRHYSSLFGCRGWHIHYDLRDDWEQFASVGQAKWYHSAFEIDLIERSASISAVSITLLNKAAAIAGIEGKSAAVVPNGATSEFVSLAKNSYKTRQNLEREMARKVGYFGHLTPSWFDWHAMVNTMNLMPEIKFEIIGHGMPNNLALPSNCEILGPLSHEEIIPYAEEWEVALVPFKPGPLSLAVDPIKIYEYLAMGLKVVAVRMLQLEGYPLTWLYGKPEDLPAVLEKALLHATTPEELNSLKQFLTNITWKQRTCELLTCIENGEK